MLDTSARLLRLLSLLQTRRFWTGADLSERLEITPRTLRRDVDRLRSLGYPVRATPGVAGGYQLAAGAALPPLQLDDDEALAVSVGLQTAATSSVTGIEEAALRALVKLERVLPTRLRARANALRSSTSILPRPGPRVDADTLTAVAGACSEHKHISFDYDKAQNPRWGHVDGDASTIGASVTRRCVEPVGLVSSGYRWYLVAWDVERGAWRTFRVDRIRGGVEVGASFVPRTPPDDGDLQTYVSRAVSVEPYEQQARIRLQVPLAIAAQALAPAAGVLEAVDDHSCVLTTGAASMEALAYHLLTLGVDFEVESPQALIATLRQLQERLAKALA